MRLFYLLASRLLTQLKKRGFVLILILNNSQDFLRYIAVCPYLITLEASFRKSVLERKISTAVKIQYRPAQRIRSHEPRQQNSNISYGIRALFAE